MATAPRTLLRLLFPLSLPHHSRPFSIPFRLLCSSSNSPSRITNPTASFDWSDDEDAEGANSRPPPAKQDLPPPYDPFSKKPAFEEPRDPTNLQEIFHNLRTGGLTDYAAKMFDGLSKDGLTHEALELFSQIKDSGAMPDVIAHTAVIEAYVNAGAANCKDAVRTYDRMLASGVLPNAYTLAVLVRGLARGGRLPESRKYLLEMLSRGMKPNVATYTAVLEAHVKEKQEDEAVALIKEMREKGFVFNEEEMRAGLAKRGQIFWSIMRLIFGK